MPVTDSEYLHQRMQLIDDLTARLSIINADLSKLDDLQCKDDLISGLHWMAGLLRSERKKLAVQLENPMRE